MEQVKGLIGGAAPDLDADYITRVSMNTAYAAGSLVPPVAASFARWGPGELLLPASAVPSPIDAMKAYVTDEEAFGRVLGRRFALRWLAGQERASVLRWCAAMLNSRLRPEADHETLDMELAEDFQDEVTRERATNLVRGGAALAAPQGLLTMAKLALLHSTERGSGGNDNLRAAALLAIQGSLEPGGSSATGQPGDDLAGQILRTQAFAAAMHPGTLIASFQVRWRSLPPTMTSHAEYADLEAAFVEATGTPLDDPRIAGLALFTAVIREPRLPVSIQGTAARLGWSEERFDAAIRLFASEPAPLAELARAEDAKHGGSPWAFDTLRQFPVIRIVPGVVLVVSVGLLLDRLFGWPPLFDVEEGLKAQGVAQTRISRTKGFFRRVCEAEVLDALHRIAPDVVGGRRFYPDHDMSRAYGAKRTKLADAAIDYGHSWIVAEVCTSQLTRETLVGGRPEDLAADLARTIDVKVLQLDSTIRQLIADEGKLTLGTPVERRRYLPLLVLTEGFPLNPATWPEIRSRLGRLPLTNDRRAAPLRIVDREDVYLLEMLAEEGVSALDVLVGHADGPMRDMPLNYHVSGVLRRMLGRPRALNAPFEAGWGPIREAVIGTVAGEEP
jgi:hypothetical protein